MRWLWAWAMEAWKQSGWRCPVFWLEILILLRTAAQVLLGGVERLFAMTLHVGFSFLIFKGVEEKKARWWLLAVLLHGLTDFQLVIGNLAVVEGLLAIEAVAVLLLVIRFVRREERS